MGILQAAIIGSGPAGCYLAERLLREAPGCRIDIIERLPTPFGLVRAGVAPDHQSTKAVTRVFERVMTREGVAFRGNVEIGRDASLAELRALYDVVVIATGAPEDRRLGVAGENLAGIVGSGAFAGWYNSHPDHAAATPPLDGARSVVLIGNGNVALDVARILAKTPAELAQSDIAPSVERALAAMPLEAIHIVGRRGPAQAGFAEQELRELGALDRAQPLVDRADLPPADTAPNAAIIKTLEGFAAHRASTKPVAIRFHFRARPAGFSGEGRVAAARFARQSETPSGHVDSGETLTLAADLVIRCIGYRAVDCGGFAPQDGIFANEEGRIAAGLYVVGWAKRGPSGTIATNRAESHEVAQRIVAETTPAGRSGGDALAALLAGRGVKVVDHAHWLRIDAAERAAAAGRPRAKLTDIAAMLVC
jgi:NADPH-dependent glutamate synthase beta subunit-like oxidoreductase